MKPITRSLFFFLAVFAAWMPARVDAGLGLVEEIVTDVPSAAGAFRLAGSGTAAPLWLDPADFPGVRRAAVDLQADVQRVTAVLPALSTATGAPGLRPVIIGTLGHSALIDFLVSSGKFNAADLTGKWESFVITTIANPLPGVEQALVIAGSDKRGTIYGIYELSEQLGVSPWYWWADVPVRQRAAAHIAPGRFASGEPVVKYRGIFLNDEAPALSSWAGAKFGGYNRNFYTKVFELLLRQRGNYLWPAMWGNAFNEDDPLNPVLADEYGIVMGTSHHEPMLRAQQEWSRHKTEFGNAEWNYQTNADGLKAFWRAGIARNKSYESVVTIGMRGDGDAPMISGGDMAANTALLETIVSDQRQILATETGKPAAETPQLWALYKEVQDYHDYGMSVPDDVTLLYCDDNWGNLRRLPASGGPARSGGSGVYYHFDYVGGPRSYKWLNTNPLPKIQEQMNLAWQYGADRIWIVNVGDLKPMEVPMEFFLRMAWNPARWQAEDLDDYLLAWSTREFGPGHAAEVAELVASYTKFNGRRKPELLETGTFSAFHHREAERIRDDWNSLAVRAETLHAALPAASRDAFYQLVLHPVKACSIVNDLYITIAFNQQYAAQQRASTNSLATRAETLFQEDADLTTYWNTVFAGGKWAGLMSQIHIGYTSWNEPATNVMPAVSRLEPPAVADIGVAVEGSATVLSPGAIGLLPKLSSEGGPASRFIEVFRLGTLDSPYSILANQPWVNVSNPSGTLGGDIRSEISIDWARSPTGSGEVILTVQGANASSARTVRLPIHKAAPATADCPTGFLAISGYIAIEAPHYDRAVNSNGITWKTLPDHGRALGAVTPFPVTAARVSPGAGSARLEYDVYLNRPGEISVRLIVSPTLNFIAGRGLQCAISLDGQAPQIVEVGGAVDDATWSTAVKDSVRAVTAFLEPPSVGHHVLKVWMVDPGMVLQRIEIDTGGLAPSYLGPPESPRGRRVASAGNDAPSSSVVVQAESGNLGTDFVATSGVTPASIFIITDGGGSSPASAARVASYQVVFPAAGSYRLFARIRVGPAAANDDSLFIGNGFGTKNPATTGDWKTINNLSSVGFTALSDAVWPSASNGSSGTGVWKWVDLSKLGGVTFTVPANALTQTFQLGGRETGLDIDKLVFGLNANSFTVEDLSLGAAGTLPGSRPFVLEAETSQVGSDFFITSGPPSYITATTTQTSSPGTAARVARFLPSFSTAGTYRVYARVRVGPGAANDDSLFIGVGFGARDPALAADWKTINNLNNIGFSSLIEAVAPSLEGTAGVGVWKWIDLTKLGGLTLTVTSASLSQTFDIAGRENGLDIDKLVFAPAELILTVADLDADGIGMAPSSAAVITVALSDVRQVIDGFGASSAWTAPNITNAQADQFFSITAGLGLSLLRVRIGQDGTTGETGTAQKAVARGAKVWATPWSPPAAWKSNGDVNNGGTLLPEYHDDWAARLADFAVAMQAAGVPLAAISAQNEPNYTATWESCVWTPAELTAFIRDHLGPALAARGVTTRVLAAEPINWYSFASYTDALLADAAARSYLTHIGTHNYGGAPIDYPAVEANGKSFWQTEYSDGAAASDPTIDSALRVGNAIHDFLTVSQGNAWHYWWMFPNGSGTASTGALVESGLMAKRGWAMGNWARFVRPGHRRVQTYGSLDTVRATAFVSPDDRRFTLVMVNSDSADRTVPLAIEGGAVTSLTPWETSATRSLEYIPQISPSADGSFPLQLPARSVTTFVSEALNRPPTAISLNGSNILENLPSGSVVGTLSATDADAGETFTYTLTSGAGDADSGAFAIVGNQLRTAALLDYETGTTRTVRIRVTDSAGSMLEQAFVISVSNDPFEYAEWSSPLPPSQRGPGTDLDGDGYSNLLTYAFGFASHESVPIGDRPALSMMEGGVVRFTFTLPGEAPSDMRYEIERSDTLGNWITLATKDGNGFWQGPSPVNSATASDGRTRFSLVATMDGPSGFFRLRCTLSGDLPLL